MSRADKRQQTGDIARLFFFPSKCQHGTRIRTIVVLPLLGADNFLDVTVGRRVCSIYSGETRTQDVCDGVTIACHERMNHGSLRSAVSSKTVWLSLFFSSHSKLNLLIHSLLHERKNIPWWAKCLKWPMNIDETGTILLQIGKRLFSSTTKSAHLCAHC